MLATFKSLQDRHRALSDIALPVKDTILFVAALWQPA